MPLLLLTLIALLQWVTAMYLPSIPDFNPTTFLYGNLQIIIILWSYRVTIKYARIKQCHI